MDVKYVLSSVLQEAQKIGASGSLQAGVRLSGAVNGERGEGYWLLYEDNLVLLYRKLGQRDYEGCCGEPADWSFENYREEKYALLLTAGCKEANFEYEFTPSERESAEIILNAITAAHAEPQAVYSQDMLIMAGLFVHLGNGHEDFARNLMGKALWRAGQKYADKCSLVDLVKLGNEHFSTEQKQSVMVNLICQRMSDDVWSSEESAALQELSGVWQLPEEFFGNAVDILLMQKSIGELFKN